MKKNMAIFLVCVALQGHALQNSGEQVAATVMNTWKDSFALDGKPAGWSCDMGVILKGFEGIWLHTGNSTYYNYIQKMVDFFIQEDGCIKDYKPAEYNINNVSNGKLLLLLYRVTGKEKYLQAAKLVREQLRSQPRTREGGFWHKKIYPNQVWLDDLYMSEPFYAEYADLAHEDTAFNDIANQFIWMEKHTRDAKTGLLHQAWDESKEQQWANKITGCPPHFWAKAMGWYTAALVDVLDWFPPNQPKKNQLIAILNRTINAVEKVQDSSGGLWFNIPDMPPGKDNYTEASASSLFVYAIAKGVRLGYLPATKISVAKKGYAGIVKKFIKTENGQTNLYGTINLYGLGDNPYCDGCFEYYRSETAFMNDPAGMGAFILASNEMEMLPTQTYGKGKTIVLDYYFNNEYKKNTFGQIERFHYTWQDKSNSGYYILGSIFQRYGAVITQLETAPTIALLKNSSVYIIVDPDTDKETANPHCVQPADATAIYDWVQAGGVLLLLSNDSGNAEFTHFNQLAAKFGIHFNENCVNKVTGDHYETGAFDITPGDTIFRTSKKVYIKELSTLELNPPAKAHFTNSSGDIIMAIAKVGKGTVFAAGDPWFYNEYTDGRKLPPAYENYRAATDIVKWLLKQVPVGKNNPGKKDN